MKQLTNFEKVAEFQRLYNCPVRATPTCNIPNEEKDLRLLLIEEEFGELIEAINNNNITAIADAIGDLLYVVYGAACVFGFDADKVFDAIHTSNLSKLGPDGKPVYREDGKVLKGPTYAPPDIERALYGNN